MLIWFRILDSERMLPILRLMIQDFQKWLQFADLNKQLDEIYDNNINISENDKLLYKHRLKEISELSFADYPFEI